MRDASDAPATGASLTSFELDALTSGMERGVTTASDTARASSADAALANAPFDTKIAYQVRGDTLVFRIPPSLNLARIVVAVFITGWLIGWTAAIVFAATTLSGMLRGGGEPRGGAALFMGGWLLAALAGEAVALWVLASSVSSAFARRFVICTPDTLFVVVRVWFLKRVSSYQLRYVRNLAAADGIKSMTTPIPDQWLGFDYGKRKVLIPGVTQPEANWIAESIEGFRGTP